MWRTRSTQNVPFLPFLVTCINNLTWLYYGLWKQDSTLITVNAVGAVLQSICMFTYLVASKQKSRPMSQIFVGVVYLTALYLYLTVVITSRTVLVDRLGLAGAGITMLMYASPMMELVTVIRTKSTRSISRPLTVATFFASSLWFYYGYLLQDPYVQVPNFPGIISSIVRLYFFWRYPVEKVA
ncbi:SLC50A1 [Branchiostoma lanceolatum]|nr:SLC50A1 [Branchiostoma lanceolatum]